MVIFAMTLALPTNIVDGQTASYYVSAWSLFIVDGNLEEGLVVVKVLEVRLPSPADGSLRSKATEGTGVDIQLLGDEVTVLKVSRGI